MFTYNQNLKYENAEKSFSKPEYEYHVLRELQNV